MRAMTADDRRGIQVGRPLQVSIYGGDQTLLLAVGRVVPNEFVREGLLRTGAYCGNEDEAADKVAAAAREPSVSDAIATLQADYQHIHARSQTGFRMEREGVEGFGTARIIGVSEDGHGLIMTCPTSAQGEAIPIEAGEVWTFRAFYATAALRFRAIVENLTCGPFCYFYASGISGVERRDVRKWPRTPTCLWAARDRDMPRVLVDVSVGGARMAVTERSAVQQGQVLMVHPLLSFALGSMTLSLDATVLNLYGRADPKHPRIEFYGLRFEHLTDAQRLTLHAYVQENLTKELDRTWQVLTLTP
jgi:hypothetical protein